MLGFRTACEQTWGAGVYEEVLELLPPQVREANGGLFPVEEWVPESFFVAWIESVWRGPAKRDPKMIRRYVRATIAHGYGRVRRLFVQLLTPETLAGRASETWRAEHNTGVLKTVLVAKNRARLQLVDHPYVATPPLRMSLAEALRFTASLTRARNVIEMHTTVGVSLIIDSAWEPKGLIVL